MYCSKSKWSNPEMSFFSFPREEKRCKKWVQFIRRQDLLNKSGKLSKSVGYCHRNLRLCSDHFEDSQFMNPKKKKLVWNALPTCFSLKNCPPKITLERKVPKRECATKREKKKKVRETSQKKLQKASFKIRTLTNSLRAKNREILRLKKKLEKSRQIEEIIVASKKFLTPDEHQLFAMQMRNSLKKNLRYTESFKAFAIGVYFKSPVCYRFLEKRFRLPSKSTILRWMSKIRFQEGFCENMFKMLKYRVQKLKEDERMCTMMMDEITLKAGVDYDAANDKVLGIKAANAQGKNVFLKGALLFVVSGLKSHWRQAFSYFFIQNAMKTDSLRPLVLEALSKLEEIGLKVKVLCSDQGSNFMSLLSSLLVTKEKPYFTHNGNKIYCFADPPHVLKSTRNCLAKYKIETSTGTADWSVIEQLYKEDKERKIRLCPKLRKSHFNLTAFGAKMKVKWASQVLSHSVAAALSTASSFGAMGPNAGTTATFVENLNNLFDTLNSSQKKGKTRYRSGISGNKDDPIVPFLDEMKEWIATWKIWNEKGEEVTQKFRFIDGWLLDIEAVKLLVKELTEVHGYEYLLTRRICTDAVENLFCIVRSGKGFDQYPSCLGFAQAIKHAMTN